jgi:hypothetical protein
MLINRLLPQVQNILKTRLSIYSPKLFTDLDIEEGTSGDPPLKYCLFFADYEGQDESKIHTSPLKTILTRSMMISKKNNNKKNKDKYNHTPKTKVFKVSRMRIETSTNIELERWISKNLVPNRSIQRQVNTLFICLFFLLLIKFITRATTPVWDVWNNKGRNCLVNSPPTSHHCLSLLKIVETTISLKQIIRILTAVSFNTCKSSIKRHIYEHQLMRQCKYIYDINYVTFGGQHILTSYVNLSEKQLDKDTSEARILSFYKFNKLVRFSPRWYSKARLQPLEVQNFDKSYMPFNK